MGNILVLEAVLDLGTHRVTNFCVGSFTLGHAPDRNVAISDHADEFVILSHRQQALVMANAAPRCGARSKRTGKPCRGAAMPNGRCRLHGGKSTGPRTPEGLERSRRANWKHGHFSREAKAERSRVRAAMLAVRYLRDSI
jgi:hypothetical protein